MSDGGSLIANGWIVPIDDAGTEHVRIVASRGSMDLGVSEGGLPPDDLVEKLDAVLDETERLAGVLHEPGPGAHVQIAVAPCSPFSVTGRLMDGALVHADESEIAQAHRAQARRFAS